MLPHKKLYLTKILYVPKKLHHHNKRAVVKTMARLAFFGTPEFSLPALRAVHHFCCKQKHEFMFVVSQQDKPKGRGKKLLFTPVKQQAQELGIKVLQPSTLKKSSEEGESFYQAFKEAQIDLAIVVAYGKLIPQRLLSLPAKGFVNVHASLLPRFRGAAPAQRAIEAGDRITGVCLMDVVKELDQGDIFAKESTPILPFDTGGSLLFRLSYLGAHLLGCSFESLLHGKMHRQQQEDSKATYAPMIKKEEGAIDWCLKGRQIKQKVSAFDPWPGAYAFLRGKRIKFFDPFFIATSKKMGFSPGQVVVAGDALGIKTTDGIIYFLRAQLEGKKILPIKELLLGFPIRPQDKFQRISNG